MAGVAQLAKPLGVPIGLTVEPGNTHDGRHMLRTFRQVRNDLSEGSTMIFDAGANNKTVLDTIVEDGKHYLTRKRFNRSDDAILAGFSEDAWECIDAEKGEYCLKKIFPSRVNYYFFSRDLRDLERKGVEKRARKKLKEDKDLQRDLEQGRKLRKRYRVDNVLIKATISLQTKLTEITEEEALSLLLEKGITGREGFFCLVSDRDMDPREARSKYRSKDVVEKLFSSMKSDIGIRPIRAWTDDAVDGVLLIGFLAQAMVSVTRFLCEPASSTATKFITDAMQKLTLTVVRRKDGERRFVLSNFTPLNESVQRCYGLFLEAPTCESSLFGDFGRQLEGPAQRDRATVKNSTFRISQRTLLSKSGFYNLNAECRDTSNASRYRVPEVPPFRGAVYPTPLRPRNPDSVANGYLHADRSFNRRPDDVHGRMDREEEAQTFSRGRIQQSGTDSEGVQGPCPDDGGPSRRSDRGRDRGCG